MKTKIETTHKTTVTFSTKEFLKRLGLERSGILEIVFVKPEMPDLSSFAKANSVIKSTVSLTFKTVEETRELEY